MLHVLCYKNAKKYNKILHSFLIVHEFIYLFFNSEIKNNMSSLNILDSYSLTSGFECPENSYIQNVGNLIT